METVYNFSAGPSTLPKDVLTTIQAELLDYQHSGMSVLELNHRGPLFQEILLNAETLLREIMVIPDDYHVLFLQGGASLQFTMVPLNLAQQRIACYTETGLFAQKAIQAAKMLPSITVQTIVSSTATHFSSLPTFSQEQLPKEAAYLHITTNNTVEGTTYYTLPDTGDVPLVADMSSNILAFPYDVRDFGLIYAGAQKNLGPAGVTVVIVRQDLLPTEPLISPMLDYRVHASEHSCYNTPPTFAIYCLKLVLEWVKECGGVPSLYKSNQQKAQRLYDALDHSELFRNNVHPTDRSLTNIPFTTGDSTLDARFIAFAKANGLINLAGHRSLGGMRASLYNAFPLDGVEALIACLTTFEQNWKES